MGTSSFIQSSSPDAQANMPEIKLLYFDLYGRGEIIRLILKYAGVDFKDERMPAPFVDDTEWKKVKPTLPGGQLPVLYWDGEMMAQSMTISRFLANQFNLAGRTNLDSALIDEMVDHIQDMNDGAYRAFFEPDEDKKKEKFEQYEKETLPRMLGMIERRMVSGGGQYLAANTLSWADLHFVQSILVLRKMFPSVLDSFSHLAGLVARVTELPNIKEYLAQRPQSDI